MDNRKKEFSTQSKICGGRAYLLAHFSSEKKGRGQDEASKNSCYRFFLSTGKEFSIYSIHPMCFPSWKELML
jgi:hypothetical protein